MGAATSKLFESRSGKSAPAPSTLPVEPEETALAVRDPRDVPQIDESFLVYSYISTRLVDSDGNVADDFYEEVEGPRRPGEPPLRRVTEGLRPEGRVAYPVPRLSPSYPLVLVENTPEAITETNTISQKGKRKKNESCGQSTSRAAMQKSH